MNGHLNIETDNFILTNCHSLAPGLSPSGPAQHDNVWYLLSLIIGRNGPSLILGKLCQVPTQLAW